MKENNSINKVKAYLKSKEGIISVLSLALDGQVFDANYPTEFGKKYTLSTDRCFEDKLASIILNGGYFFVTDIEEEEDIKVTKEMWDNGIDQMDDLNVLNDWAEENYDWYTAYATIQYILFGEVIYC